MKRFKKVKKAARSGFRAVVRVFSEGFYWLRTHTIDRYHLIDCRSEQHDYAWGWCDRDQLMLLACFAILKAFVEKELPHSYTDYTEGPWKDAMQEVDILHRWWMNDRAAHHKAAAEGLYVDKACNSLDALLDRDNEMLIRLIKVRGYLWT